MGFYDDVFSIVKLIPEGKVVTYGQIAKALGNPRASRAVGWALRTNKEPIHMPCHRVVNQSGRLAKEFVFGGEQVQRGLLEREGVQFRSDGKVDMQASRWNMHYEK